MLKESVLREPDQDDGNVAPPGVSLGVVVVAHDSDDVLPDFLRTLQTALIGVQVAGVVIIDNGSARSSVACVGHMSADATIVRLPNRGYAAGLNAGFARLPHCDAYLVCNPDIRLDTGSVGQLLSNLGEPDVGIVAPRLVDAHHRLIPTLRRAPTVARMLGAAALGGRRSGRFDRWGEVVTASDAYETPKDVSWALGACLLVTRRCLETTGPWDESFFLYSEETDFCLRASTAGFRILFDPAARALHLGGNGAADIPSWMYVLLVRNKLRLFAGRNGRFRRTLYLVALGLFELRALATDRSSRAKHGAALRALVAPPMSLLPADRFRGKGEPAPVSTGGRTGGLGCPRYDTTVIIPAWNEMEVLPACLGSLVGQIGEHRMLILVVANGCTDDTAAVASSFDVAARHAGHELRVVELDGAEPSKSHALNAADAISDWLLAGDVPADDGIRVYLDADVTLAAGSIAGVHAVFKTYPIVQLCQPRIAIAPTRSPCTGGYGRIWSNLPYVRDDVIGAGFYAVTDTGRRRWNTFPSIIADDKFVRLHFAQHERMLATDSTFVVHLPEGLRELVRVRGRWIRANWELRRGYPCLARDDKRRFAGLGWFLISNPHLWRDMPIFLVVYALAQVHAFRTSLYHRPVWERATRARSLRAP